MAYTELKEGLSRLLHQDLQNRQSLQEVRRNVFLHSDNLRKQKEELEEQAKTIQDLQHLIAHKKTGIQSKDERIQELEHLLASEAQKQEEMRMDFEARLQGFKSQESAEIEALKAQLATQQENLLNEKEQEREKVLAEQQVWAQQLQANYEQEIQQLEEQFQQQIEGLLLKNNELSHQLMELQKVADRSAVLATENSTYAEKIRSLIYALDERNEKNAHLERELLRSSQQNESLAHELSEIKVVLQQWQEKPAQVEDGEKINLLQAQLFEVQALLQIQNTELHSFQTLKNDYQQSLTALENDRLLIVQDNGNLIAEMEILREEIRHMAENHRETESTLEGERIAMAASQQEMSATIHTLELQIQEQLAEINDLKSYRDIRDAEKEEHIEGLKEIIRDLEEQLSESKFAFQQRIQFLENEKSQWESSQLAFSAPPENLNQDLQAIEQLKADWNRQEEEYLELIEGLREENKLLQDQSSEAQGFHAPEQETSLQLQLAQKESENLRNELSNLNFAIKTMVESHREQIEVIETEKYRMESELKSIREKIAATSLPSGNNPKEDEFIEGLFKQIDALNDERLRLIGQKEETETELKELQGKLAELSIYMDAKASQLDQGPCHTEEAPPIEGHLNMREAQNSPATDLFSLEKNIDSDIKNLEETNKQIKLASAFILSGMDRKEARKKITELVREIDKCIALLSV